MTAIPIKDPKLYSDLSLGCLEIDDRFGRCDYYALVSDKEIKVLTNESKNEASGAGGSAIKNLAAAGVTRILSPQLGPKAIVAARAYEIPVYLANENSLEEQIKALENEALQRQL